MKEGKLSNKKLREYQCRTVLPPPLLDGAPRDRLVRQAHRDRGEPRRGGVGDQQAAFLIAVRAPGGLYFGTRQQPAMAIGQAAW